MTPEQRARLKKINDEQGRRVRFPWLLPLLVFVLLLVFCRHVGAGTHNIYFVGGCIHYQQDDRNEEGIIPLVGYSYLISYNNFNFDSGANVFKDSYGQVGGALFSNISHENFTYKYFTPMLGVGITNKGDSYNDDSRQTYPFVIPKLKVGKRSGFFATLSAAYEFASIEFGFNW